MKDRYRELITAIGAVFDAAARVGWTYLGELVQKPMFTAEFWDQLVADHQLQKCSWSPTTRPTDRLMMTHAQLSKSRRIQAPTGEIFRILAHPEMHLPLDGSEMLRGAESKEIISGIGDVFVMNMHFHVLGDYQMDNHVVEFEPNRRIGWEPVAGAGHPQIGTGVGHRWCFRLEPDGPDATIVTEIYDCSRAPQDFRQQMNNGSMWIESMEETLKRLDEMVPRR